MRFWTRQHEAVWDELQKTGQYIVKKEYIEEKNDTISEFYLKLYEWYTKAARKYIDIPEDLKYPIWLSVSEDMMLQPTEHAIIFEVEIPEGEYLICNFDKWGYRVNYFYVPLDEADEKAQIKEELTASGYVRRKFTKKKVKLTNKPMHYISSDGYDIYVGKNNIQNDELTFSFANGGDWWFHAKGAPGSHVIVKTNGDELPDRTFEEAGRLAAYYSKNRGSDKVEIDYIEKKHVKKPNGAKPGFVVYYTNYSLVIDSDISNIKVVQD